MTNCVIIKNRKYAFKDGRGLGELRISLVFHKTYADKIAELLAIRAKEKESPKANSYMSPYKQANAELARFRKLAKDNHNRLLIALLACHNSAIKGRYAYNAQELALMQIRLLTKAEKTLADLELSLGIMIKGYKAYADAYENAHLCYGQSEKGYKANLAKLAKAEKPFDNALAQFRPCLINVLNIAKGGK